MRRFVLTFKIPELKIYTLFADSDANVSERNRVKYIVYYNDNCASKLFYSDKYHHYLFGMIKYVALYIVNNLRQNVMYLLKPTRCIRLTV